MFKNESFKIAFEETMFLFIEIKGLSIIPHLFYLLQRYPLFNERLCNWNDYKEQTFECLRNQDIQDKKWFNKTYEKIYKNINRETLEEDIQYFNDNYNTSDCIKSLLITYINKYDIPSDEKKKNNLLEKLEYKRICSIPLSENEIKILRDNNFYFG